MHQLDELDEDNWAPFSRCYLLALIGFVAMVIIMLPHIKPTEVETQDHKARQCDCRTALAEQQALRR